MMFNNGCMCCIVCGDFVWMLGEFFRNKKGMFDYIIIEIIGEEMVLLILWQCFVCKSVK